MTDAADTYHSKSEPPDRWWITALISGVVAAALTLMLRNYPTTMATWMLGAAIAVFAIVNYFNPRHWLRRRSGTCLGIAGAAAAMPSIAGAIHLPQGWLEASTTSSPWLAAVFGFLSFCFAWLDRQDVSAFSSTARSPTPATEREALIAVRAGNQSAISVSSTSQSRDAIHAGDHASITVHHGLDRDASNRDVAIALADKAIAQATKAGRLEGENTFLAEANDQLKSELASAMQRVGARAAETGDPQAKAAIAEARQSGDLTKLDAALDAEFARREAEVREQAADWFELCRESAAVAYVRGDIDKAELRLETILRFHRDDLDAINRLGLIHHLRGRLDESESSYRRVLELSTGAEAYQAVAYVNLGVVLQTRGDLEGAEAMHRKSLAIEEKLGRLEGMANQYGNLGLVLKTRGDLDGAEAIFRKSRAINEKLSRLEGLANDYGNLGVLLNTRGDLNGAEAMYRKSLAINEKLGWLEGLASVYGNLGVVLKTRGDLDGAEAMYRKSLAIDEKLGRLEGMARDYGNLGVLLNTRGDLDGAEVMYRKSLEIDEKLGWLEGMADQYCNLGIVLKTRGDLDGAEVMYRKSLAINEKLGRLEGIANQYGNLGNVLKTRGDLDGAEAMYRKSLAIDEKLGRLEGMASHYGNLGVVLETRRDLDGAEVMYRKSLAIDEKLGRLEGMANQYGNLGIVLKIRGDLAGAREMWMKSRELFARLGAKPMVAKAQGLLDSLPAD